MVMDYLEVFARGGGGGSSGGGDASYGIAAIGYFIGFYVTKIIRKIVNEEKAKLFSLVAMGLITVIFILFIMISGSFLATYLIALIIAGLWTGWYTQFHGIWDKLKNKIKKADVDLGKAQQADSSWDETKLHELCRATFMRYQDDWTRLDEAKLSEYITANYALKTSLLLQILRDLNRQNAVMNPEIIKIDTVEVHDNADNNQDSFTVLIEAKANDTLINLSTRETIFSDNNTFTEFWTFNRTGNNWLLDSIDQTTADQNNANQTLVQLATQNSMYYSLDMGWLFLPERGQVFKDGSFGVSDINNHIVGTINNILVQIYTYKAKPGKDGSIDYVIGQINVPKYYGNILVRPKISMFNLAGATNKIKPPENSSQYEYEWTDFNKKFEVFATEGDRLASFELINPKFMEMMYEIDEALVLEVVDNNIYFRVSQKTNLDTYTKLMELLKQAHKELKL